MSTVKRYKEGAGDSSSARLCAYASRKALKHTRMNMPHVCEELDNKAAVFFLFPAFFIIFYFEEAI